MTKTIIKFSGGFGNQLFQYAIAKHFELEKNSKIILDFNFYKKYFLHKIYINNIFLNSVKLKYYKSIVLLPNKLFFLKFYFSLINSSQIIKEKNNYKFMNFNEIKKKNLYLDGYWQNEKYFYKNKNFIKKNILTFLNKNKKNNVEKKFLTRQHKQKYVMIHLRLKDYLSAENLAKHGQLNFVYYTKAINLINSISKNNTFIIFSDDQMIAKKKFSFLKQKYFFQEKKLQDPISTMYFMSICDHFIIANSTFSWWAAYLNFCRKKIVICPKKWFKEKKLNFTTVPKNWISI